MISDEALNAAFEAYYANLKEGGPSACSAAISAVAPILMAQAWDEGYESADEDAPHSVKSPNPYRSPGVQAATPRGDLAEWERCPKRHASQGQHLLDCETNPYRSRA